MLAEVTEDESSSRQMLRANMSNKRNRWNLNVKPRLIAENLPVRNCNEKGVSKVMLDSWLTGAEAYFTKTKKLANKLQRVREYPWEKVVRKLRKYKVMLDVGDVRTVRRNQQATTIRDEVVSKSIKYTFFASRNVPTSHRDEWKNFKNQFNKREATEQIDDVDTIFRASALCQVNVNKVFQANITRMKDLLSLIYEQRILQEKNTWKELLEPLPTISGKNIFEHDHKMSTVDNEYIENIISGVNRRGFTVVKVPEEVMDILTEDVVHFATELVRNHGENIFATPGTSIQTYSSTRKMVDCSHSWAHKLQQIGRQDSSVHNKHLHQLIIFLQNFSHFLSLQAFYKRNGLDLEDIGYSILASFGSKNTPDLLQNLHRDYGKKRKRL